MLKEYKKVLSKIPEIFQPLMAPHLAKLDAALEPGISMLTWTSLNLNSYIESVYDTLREFELLIDRANDIKEFRIEKVFADISKTVFCELPTDQPWTMEYFSDRTQVIMFSMKHVHKNVNSSYTHSKPISACNFIY